MHNAKKGIVVKMKEKMLLMQADVSELKSVEKLYKSVRGQKGCVWNEEYPTFADIENDFKAGCLYVFARGGEIIGAASVVPENELDDLDCFSVKDGTHLEIARVVIARQYQGNGYSENMLAQLFAVLYDKGCRSVHLLVIRDNHAAIKTYRKLDFSFLGECSRYGHDYFICEKLLGKPRLELF